MKKIKKVLFGLIFFIIYFLNFVFPAPCVLADVSSMKVVPSIIEDLIEPGEIIEKEIKVVNYSDMPITVYVYIKDFKAADETGKAELIVPGTEEGNYISSWLNITNEAIDFVPGEERVVPFTINIPEDIGPGGYYGAIVFGTEPPEVRAKGEEKGAAIGISQQTASLILLQRAGDAIEKAIIKEFNADKQLYNVPFEVNFTTRIENLGNVHIKPRGIIEVNNMLGRKVAVIIVNDEGGNILPSSARIFKNTWKDDFGFGRYEASLAISFGTPADKGGEGRKTLAIKRYFWVLPVRPIVSAVLSLLLTLILFIIFLKIYKRRAIKKVMERMGVGRKYITRKSYYSPRNNFVLTFLILLVVALVVMGLIYFLLF